MVVELLCVRAAMFLIPNKMKLFHANRDAGTLLSTILLSFSL